APVIHLRAAEHRMVLAAPHALAARPVRPRDHTSALLERARSVLSDDRADLVPHHAIRARHDPRLEQREVGAADTAVPDLEQRVAIGRRGGLDVANLERAHPDEERRPHGAILRRPSGLGLLRPRRYSALTVGGAVDGGMLAARALHAAGVRTLFALPGGHNMPLFRAAPAEGLR